MVYTIYNGVLTGGWLTFFLVLFSILTVALIIWLLLYIEMSQRQNWKLTTLIVVITSLVTAFEVQLILLVLGVII
jgi:formate-dependent nitrite reductase membrane component NrfD